MAPLKSFLHNLRWYQWLLSALVLFYLLYIALSYLYLPGKLQAVLRQDVAAKIGREIQVDKIAFNPFSLLLSVDAFAIADRAQKPLLAWQRLAVDLDLWGSLFGWQLRLSAVSLDAPQVNLERRKDDFNFSDILQRFATAETTPATTDDGGFAIRVDDIQLRDGHFHFDDRSGNKPAASTLDQVNLGVQDLYIATGEDHLNPFSLKAQLPGGGDLVFEGEYRIDPLQLNSRIALTDLNLPTFADFVENVVPLRMTGGRVDVQAQVLVQQEQALQLRIQDGTVQVRQLALDDAQTDPPLLRAKQLEIKGIALDLQQRTVRVDSLVFDNIDTHQWLKDGGELRFTPLLAQHAADATPPAVAEPAAAWDVTLGEYRIQNGSVHFTDFSGGVNAVQRLSDIQFNLRDISLEEGAKVPLQLTARINESGSASLNGQLTLTPLTLNLQYQVQQLPLLPFNPYVESRSHLQLQQGTLSLQGDATLADAESGALQLALDLSVADLQTQDNRSGKKIVRWQNLDVQKLQLDLGARQLRIEQVALQKPDISAERGEDSQMNLATLLKAESTADASEKPDADSAPFDVRIAKVSVTDGITRFRDASVHPVFKTALHNLVFDLEDLTTTGTSPARFRLDSRIDKYAPFSVKGTLVPLQQQPGFAFTGQLRGLEMPNLSPYSGTYVGYELRSGTLSLDMDYQLRQRHLQGSNGIVAKQLYLGDTVASEQAVNAPVALGLALLRDVSGEIDLDVKVKGDLDDPGFSVAGLVFKALLNVLVKAAASPFQLLGSLVGGGEDLGQLEFAPGSAELDADAESRLSQLAQALSQRPQLMVDIRGNAGVDADVATLQLLQVRDAIAARRKMAAADLPLDTLLDDEDNRDELDDLNDDLELPDAGDREDALVKADPALEGQDLTAQVYRQMLQDVASRQSAGDAELLALADQRALAIKQYLVDSAGFDHSRIRMAKTRKADLKGRVCELGLIPG